MKGRRNARMSAGHAAESSEATRQRMLEAALELFANQGVEAASLRAITAAAGQANQTAVHYHFGNKRGLVAALLEEIQRWLHPMQQEALTALAAAGGTSTVRQLVQLASSPFVHLYMTHPRGQQAIRFMSRLTWQSGGDGQAMLVQAVQPYFLRFYESYRHLLADKPKDALLFHVYISVNNLIHGLADISLLEQHPAPDIRGLYPERPERLLEYFYDYIAGGLSSTSQAEPRRPRPRRTSR